MGTWFNPSVVDLTESCRSECKLEVEFEKVEAGFKQTK